MVYCPPLPGPRWGTLTPQDSLRHPGRPTLIQVIFQNLMGIHERQNYKKDVPVRLTVKGFDITR